ncbi:MAG: hypothetical protein RIR69_1785 [Actinomycetota bacterium]|jgi:hypothetical protein
MHRPTGWPERRDGQLRHRVATTVNENIFLGESTCAAEGATAPESLRQTDQEDDRRWKERVTPPPTGKAHMGEALR